jgi:hypothetical protein
MTKREALELTRQQDRLRALGISYADADALRRISMTLRRWFEQECGDSNNHASWAIERDEKTDKPYIITHYYNTTNTVRRTRIADKETGARKRLALIMARYPGLTAYVQSDPRGCALYILTADQLQSEHGIESIYNRGVAVA